MGQWNYVCNKFLEVRDLIEKANDLNNEKFRPNLQFRIMYKLEECIDELTPNDKINWEYYDSFRDLKSEIHEEVELMSDSIEDCEINENTIDYYLSEFYDLCDCARIFLEI